MSKPASDSISEDTAAANVTSRADLNGFRQAMAFLKALGEWVMIHYHILVVPSPLATQRPFCEARPLTMKIFGNLSA